MKIYFTGSVCGRRDDQEVYYKIAEQWGKRILCLCKKFEDSKRLSRIIDGNKNLITKEYSNLEEAFQHIDNFLR